MSYVPKPSKYNFIDYEVAIALSRMCLCLQVHFTRDFCNKKMLPCEVLNPFTSEICH